MRKLLIDIDSPGEKSRRLRLGNLKTLFRHRYGDQFPDDNAGREDLKELLLPVSIGAHADIRMPNVIEIWAPWMSNAEAEQLIDEINRTPKSERIPSAQELGERMNLTYADRDRLHIRTIAPCDVTAAQLTELRKAKDRARKREVRQLRTEYLAEHAISKSKPWEGEGVSRRTWYRRQKSGGTGASAVKLERAGRTCATKQTEASPPEESGCPSQRSPKGPIHRRRQRNRGKAGHAPDDAMNREINGRTCANDTADPGIIPGGIRDRLVLRRGHQEDKVKTRASRQYWSVQKLMSLVLL